MVSSMGSQTWKGHLGKTKEMNKVWALVNNNTNTGSL